MFIDPELAPGVSHVDTEPVTRSPRPFNGFDRERTTYERHKAELLKTGVHQFVAIVGDELVGPHESDREAERAGFARFGPGPLYIKQVLPAEPIPASVHMPLPAYADVAALALRAEALAPAETPPGQRPFVGYERERAAYARLQPELLGRAEGKYIVLVGDALVGPVDHIPISGSSSRAAMAGEPQAHDVSQDAFDARGLRFRPGRSPS